MILNSSTVNNSISNDSLLYGIDYDKPRRKIPGHVVFDKKADPFGYQYH